MCASLLPPACVNGALPVVKVRVNGLLHDTLIDSGCSVSIIFMKHCKSWRKSYVDIITVNGQRQPCEGVARVAVNVPGVESIEIDAYVVDFQPLGFDVILGMNGIEGLGGVTIKSSSLVKFGDEGVQGQVGYSAGAAVTRDSITVVQRDFEVSFDPSSRAWTTKWKWLGDNEPVGLMNRIARYPMADSVREPFDEEILRWIK